MFCFHLGRLHPERLDERDLSSLDQEIVDDDGAAALNRVNHPTTSTDSVTDSQGMVSNSQDQVQASTEVEEEDEEVIIEDYDDEDIW